MKIVENTPSRLVLEHRPVALSAGLILITLATLAYAVVLFARGNDAGVIFLVFALSPPVFAYFFLETRRITFDRAKGTVTLSFRAPRASRGQTEAIPPDAKVVVQRPGPTPEARQVPEEGAPGVPTRAVLIREGGEEVPLGEGYSKGPEAFQVMLVVNAWLAQDDQATES